MSEDSPALAAYRASRTLFGSPQLAALTGSGYHNKAHAKANRDGVDMSRLDILQQVSLLELTGYMRNTLLRDSDVFSMAHALELRVPLVDVQVARVAASAANAMRGKYAYPKGILVEAVRDLLSPETIERPKRGFTLPFETWMRKEMFAEVDSVLNGRAVESVGLRRAGVSKVWSEFQRRRPGVNWSRPWALYTLIRWAAQNGMAETIPQDTLRSIDLPVTMAG